MLNGKYFMKNVSNEISTVVKEYKMSILLDESPNEDYYHTYKEIEEDLIDENDLAIKEKEIDDKLQYIGRTTDNYNIFKSLIKENKSIDDYISHRKNHLKNKKLMII